MRHKSNAIKLIISAVAIFSASSLFAQQSNFQFMPAPIPYPSFEPGRNDTNVGADAFGLTGGQAPDDVSIHGGGAHLIFRHAATEALAIDGGFGAYGMSGDVPGFALPFIFGTNLWNPIIEGRGTLSGFGLPLFVDLECQVVNRPGGSLILFGGPNMTLASFNEDTPYHARTGSTNAAHTTFNTKSTVFLGGVQLGVQAGVRLGQFRLAPFAMAIFQSGNANFTFDDGYRGTDQLVQSSVVNIQPFGLQVFGFDVIYVPWNLSLGGVFQHANSTTDQNGYTSSLYSLSYHFRGK